MKDGRPGRMERMEGRRLPDRTNDTNADDARPLELLGPVWRGATRSNAIRREMWDRCGNERNHSRLLGGVTDSLFGAFRMVE